MALLIHNIYGRMTGFGLAGVGTTILKQDDHKVLFSSPVLLNPWLKIKSLDLVSSFLTHHPTSNTIADTATLKIKDEGIQTPGEKFVE